MMPCWQTVSIIAKMLNKDFTPEEVIEQILVNQELLLRTAIKFVTPHCIDKDNRDWLNLNHCLVDEYHRTREKTEEEPVDRYWKPKRGTWDK